MNLDILHAVSYLIICKKSEYQSSPYILLQL